MTRTDSVFGKMADTVVGRLPDLLVPTPAQAKHAAKAGRHLAIRHRTLVRLTEAPEADRELAHLEVTIPGIRAA
jgi:hypothetical protein